MFYLLMFGTAQHGLVGILGVVSVEKVDSISSWIDLGKQGWLAQLGPEAGITNLSRGQ